MGAVTTAILVGAAVAGAGATAVSTRQSTMAAKTQKRMAANVADAERERQAKESAIIAKQEKAQAQKTAGVLRATAGKRSGRRSLISGSELGTKATLGGQ